MSPHRDHPPTTSLKWVRSSYSGVNTNCVEIAALPDGNRALRDSKNPTGPALTLTPRQFTALLSQLR